MKTRCIIVSLLALGLLLCGCAAARKKVSRETFAMDTFVTLTACGPQAEQALDECVRALSRWEALLSTTLSGSNVSRVNAAAGALTPVSRETAEALEAAISASELTGGAFDVTVYPLVDAWGFLTDAPRVPEAETLRAALEKVDYQHLALTGGGVRLPAGMGVDLGGIAKGCASDWLADILRAQGVKSAILNLGGNVYALGKRPEGGKWRVGVTDPAESGSVAGVIEASDTAVVTSGAYQRGFTEENVYYHHILNPKTGMPADSDLISATVVSKSGARADALSTALFVLGEAEAISLWERDGSFDMILITDDGRILVSGALSFTPAEGTPYRVERIG